MDQLALHEWNCPSCGATTRARMADRPFNRQREVWDRLKTVADDWEFGMPQRPVSEISAAVRAVSKVCVQDLRKLITELERDYS